jgi:hypothetical protein
VAACPVGELRERAAELGFQPSDVGAEADALRHWRYLATKPIENELWFQGFAAEAAAASPVEAPSGLSTRGAVPGGSPAVPAASRAGIPERVAMKLKRPQDAQRLRSL